VYFPHRYNNLSELEFENKVLNRTKLLAKSIESKWDGTYDEEIEMINKYFINTIEPKNFNTSDPKGVLVEMDNSFEDVCFLLEHHGVSNPKELSVYEFQKRLEIIERKLPKKNGSENQNQQVPYTR
jgi:hypothetical protein